MFINPVNLLCPMYLFGGITPVQQILPYVLDFINTKKQIVQLISRFNINLIYTNMNVLKGESAYSKSTSLAGNFKARMAAFISGRTNWGAYVMDKETEKFEQIQIPLGGLTDILQQQGELLSLFTRIPVSKLFGQAPRGMNTTGEYDANNYNDLIHSYQENKMRPYLTYCIELIMLHLWGEIDSEIKFDFVPLGELNESSQSQLKTEKVNRIIGVANAGLFTPQGAQKLLVEDPELEFDGYEDGDIAFEAEEDYTNA